MESENKESVQNQEVDQEEKVLSLPEANDLLLESMQYDMNIAELRPTLVKISKAIQNHLDNQNENTVEVVEANKLLDQTIKLNTALNEANKTIEEQNGRLEKAKNVLDDYKKQIKELQAKVTASVVDKKVDDQIKPAKEDKK